MTDDTDRSGEHVACNRGHVYHYSDLDPMGLDYHCPECFARVATGDVTAAERGENEIDSRLLDGGSQ